ncbi:MAG TPA: hypothetical protein P5193_02970 [Microthrixaceae bacterium]|nr:hypothetical protein [Microthrixaceae bacterium]MCB9374663.1 hypothetical protein [Microthrixaceae bacterium]MCB9400713.1 hypothetical protein [Microthrixaceae bacterium]MCC6185182.1 hypothetical protein [Microthrixaceae bacterium]MCO5305573.1 hypothetical protein [Microthrixaceae bacterium]
MSSTTGCRHCRGLCAGTADRCHDCGRWLRSQDYDAGGSPQRSGVGRHSG